jgi:hypothetical protein
MKQITCGALAVLLLLPIMPLSAHHVISAKFDPAKTTRLRGTITKVDWLNPHVHIFIDVKDAKGVSTNWAVELESVVDLDRSGWSTGTVKPGETITVDGPVARDGTHQIWGNSVSLASGKRVLNVVEKPAVASNPSNQPVPRGPDGHPRLGPAPGQTGYWSAPTASSLMETGVNAQVDANGLLKNIADASKVAPFQTWARDLYVLRQRNFLKDDPMFVNCLPPGGPRQFQTRYGIQFLENRERQRIFVMMGGANRNWRLIYLDGRAQVGQRQGDDDNPLYFGRSVAKWEGDTLVVDTIGFNEKFWLSNGGLPHTQQLHLTERFSRPSFDTLKYEVTVDDPGAYTRKWSSGWTMSWVPNEDPPEYFCQDNRP